MADESGRRGGRRESGRGETGRRESGRRGRREPAESSTSGLRPAFTGGARSRPRPQLSLELIVDTAVALLDDGGSDALTFRRLAQELSVGVASMYWYVDSKDVLLDLALDQVLGEIRTDTRAARVGDWTAQLRYASLEMYRVLVAHRWAAAQLVGSADAGPNILRLWEYLAGVLRSAGFSTEQGFNALTLVINHAVASGIQEATITGPGTLTARERRRRMRERADFLAALNPQRYPAIVAGADTFATHDQAAQYAAGVEVIIAGLERQLAG